MARHPSRLLRSLAVVLAVALVACTSGSPQDTGRPDGDGAPPPTAAPVPRPDTTDDGGDQLDATHGGRLSPEVLLVWTRGELSTGLADDVAALDGVRASSVVRGGRTGLVSSRDHEGGVVDAFEDGWVAPLEILAIEPTLADLVEGDAAGLIRALEPGHALLSETSAQLRRLAEGAHLQLTAGVELEVVGIVPDGIVGAGEVVVSTDSPAATGLPQRYLLAHVEGDRLAFERAVGDRLPSGTRARVRDQGETALLRHADGVAAQAQVKERFGEFVIREEGDTIVQSPAWVRDNIVTATVPILGRVRCHEAFIELLGPALAEIERQGFGDLLDPGDTAGCHQARVIAGDSALSRHAWGAAIDVNASTNPFGAEPELDPRIVAIMRDHGFAWGGDWLVADGMHFEWYGHGSSEAR